MNFLSALIEIAKARPIWIRHPHGEMEKRDTTRSVMRSVVRPPLIGSAPKEKKEWLQQEIDDFYQHNPIFK